jgi:hypothetical protein
MTAILTNSALGERFAAQVRAANTATRAALTAVLDPLLATVPMQAIAEHLTEDAMEKFEEATAIQATQAGPMASCKLVFDIDRFFTEASLPHTLYVHSPSGKFVRSSLDEETEELTEDEEEGLILLLKQPRSQFSRFLAQLQRAFPTAEAKTSLVRDYPTYLSEERNLFYGPHLAEDVSETEFWHLDVHIQMPIFTEDVMESLAGAAITVRGRRTESPAEAEDAAFAEAGAGAGVGGT